MDADLLKLRMQREKNWGAELWLSTRCDMQITLFNIINKVEQRWINNVEVDLNEENEIIRVNMKYGEPYRQNGKFDVQMLVYKLFYGQEWVWNKYNNQNQIICSGRNIDDVVDFEKFWREINIKEKNNQSVRKVEKKKDIQQDDYVTLLEKGVELKHRGKYQEAKEMYIKAIHIDNSHPNAYNNLGKILYILGDYEASARAYKAAYERGICELMNSMQIELYRVNYSSFYIHVGHALLDKEYIDSQYSHLIKEYREGIDPTSVKGYIPERGTLRKSAYNEYDKMCIEEAKKYLGV